jgi:hypothetical protein
MIMIEHFSKWVELVAFPNKSSHSTNQVSYNKSEVGLGLVLSALLIKDQNS